MNPKLFTIKPTFAARNKIPSIFAGVVLRETSRAMYIYGHGTKESLNTGCCCVCGRELTHPVSVALGIGPQCGEHWWDWNRVGGFTEENIERLKQEIGSLMLNMKIDGWIPKSVCKGIDSSNEIINVPEDHKMIAAKKEKPISREAKLARYKNGDLVIKISFPYSQEDVQRVRQIPGRKYNPEHKIWTASLSIDNIEMLQQWNWKIDELLLKHLNKAKIDINNLQEITIPGLQLELYPYQKKGVSFIEEREGRALIADEMGLGKTAQALAWLQLHPEKRPALIVVPASLKLNWEREAEMWMKDPGVEILSGTTPYDFPIKDLTIINYDILSHWYKHLKLRNFSVLIADEVHYIKNNSAQRTKAFKQLSKGIPHLIALSGTPIVNRPVEFLNAIQLIDPTLFPNGWHYLNRYCGAHHNGFGWNFSGATNTQELHEKLSKSIMIRRLKKDVLSDLPDKQRSFFPLKMDDKLRKEYNIAETNFIEYLKETKGEAAAEKASGAETLTSIEGLKQLAIKAKIEHAIDWISDFLHTGNKLVVFVTHKLTIDRLMSEFTNIAVKIDGSVSSANRQIAVDKFQNNPDIKLFIGNIKAAGVGITLTASSNVAFLELPWTPGELVQAEDRCHRIGQKDSVNVYYLLAENTIEEEIANMLDSKRKVLDRVLDGKPPEEGSMIAELINKYLNKTT